MSWEEGNMGVCEYGPCSMTNPHEKNKECINWIPVAEDWLRSKPVEPNEHNLHIAARIVAAAAILLGIGWVAYLFWMRV